MYLKVNENWKYHKERVANYWLVKLDSSKRRKVLSDGDICERVNKHFLLRLLNLGYFLNDYSLPSVPCIVKLLI